jgi:hypothetical protein
MQIDARFFSLQVESSPGSRNTGHSSVSGGISPSPNPSQNPAQPSTASGAVPRAGFLEPAPNTLRIEDLGTTGGGAKHGSAGGGLSSSSHAPILRRGAKPLDGSGSVSKMVRSRPPDLKSLPQCGPDLSHPEPSAINNQQRSNSYQYCIISHPLEQRILHCTFQSQILDRKA